MPNAQAIMPSNTTENKGDHPPWLKRAQSLADRSYNDIAILDQLSPPQAIAGFILTCLGYINPSARLIVRQDNRLNDWLKDHSLPLFDNNLTNPSLLTYLIDQNMIFGNPLKDRLKYLAIHAGRYRQFPDNFWWRFGEIAQDSKVANRSLFNHFRYLLISHGSDSATAYQATQEFLHQLINQPTTNLHNLAPIKLVTPVLKSQGTEPDRIEYTDLIFDRSRALLLTNRQFLFAIGGSPHSGKSTLAASLYTQSAKILAECVNDGILPKDTIVPGWADLDMATPTMKYLIAGKMRRANDTRPWNRELVVKTLNHLELVQKQGHQVIFCDLPGGVPDYITQALARQANYSALVDRSFGVKNEPWEEFLLGPDLPGYVIGVHTRYKEKARNSGLRSFTSTNRGDKHNFLRGRVVDLDREIKLDDPFIQTIAHVLLFDFLPEDVLRHKRTEAHLLP